MAVHSRVFKLDLPIKNTDIIAIENANVICFTEGNATDFINLINSTTLKESFLKAKENGAIFVGARNGSSVIENVFNPDS